MRKQLVMPGYKLPMKHSTKSLTRGLSSSPTLTLDNTATEAYRIAFKTLNSSFEPVTLKVAISSKAILEFDDISEQNLLLPNIVQMMSKS